MELAVGTCYTVPLCVCHVFSSLVAGERPHAHRTACAALDTLATLDNRSRLTKYYIYICAVSVYFGGLPRARCLRHVAFAHVAFAHVAFAHVALRVDT